MITDYREGGEGMTKWCEDHVCVNIYHPFGTPIPRWCLLGELPDDPHPVTGKSYKSMWENQKRVLHKALLMENGMFKYRLIVFCWPRGEGKSLVACLLQLWKFFNWVRQQIMLGANSKDQVKFVHYDIMRDLIKNSPILYNMIGGEKNIREKEIRLRDRRGQIQSIIRSISSFSGIVSNITGYTFSEMFDMKNPKFFTQLDGSIRNIPFAMGAIDSTVSSKNHVLYNLYTNYIQDKTKSVYFSYRQSKTGDPADYWNPNMDSAQLADYKAKFPFGEFERYFLNTWEAGSNKIFSEEMIEETRVWAVDGEMFNHTKARDLLQEKNRLITMGEEAEEKGFEVTRLRKKVEEIQSRITPVSEIVQMPGGLSFVDPVPLSQLVRLGEELNTDWGILAGLDFADPLAVASLARTILTVQAKGLIGSKTKDFVFSPEQVAPKYIYILLFLAIVPNHQVSEAKELLEVCDTEYDGVDSLCSERYGAWDMAEWCEERHIHFEPTFPSYARQKEAFKEFYTVVKDGRFKAPTVHTPGSKQDDIYDEEMKMFDHDETKKWFGSPEKREKRGVQDDCIYSIGWGQYGGKSITHEKFRIRSRKMSFGEMFANPMLSANY